MRNNQADFARASELQKLGIPMEEYELERMKPASSKLSIEPDLNIPGIVLDLSGGAGFVFDLIISNDSEHRLAPAHIRIQAPWPETGIGLLADPRRSVTPPIKKTRQAVCEYNVDRNTYTFPGTRQESYRRDCVLNHRIGRSAYIYPFDDMRGLLLAVSDWPIPREYRNGQHVLMCLTVFDQYGYSRQCTVHSVVERSKKQRELAPALNDRSQVTQRAAPRGFARGMETATPKGQVAVESDKSTRLFEESYA